LPIRADRLGLLGLMMGVLLPTVALAQEPAAGLLVRIPSSRIMKEADELDKKIDRPLVRFSREKRNAQKGDFYLICDFNPDGAANSSDNFGACYQLFKKLRSLREKGIKVLAFIHGKVSHHSVLPVLACSEIMMSASPSAVLGPIVDWSADQPRPEPKPLDRAEQAAYAEVIEGRGFDELMIHKMYDRNLAVLKDKNRPASRRAGNADEEARISDPQLRRDVTASFNYERAKAYLPNAKDSCDTLDQLLELKHLPHSALIQFPEYPQVWRMVLFGPINGEMKEKVQRHVNRALGLKANELVFQLECSDGDSGLAYEMALFLAHLNDNRKDNPVVTVAYVTPQAGSTATFLALACDAIVMHPEARLGAFDKYVESRESLEPILRKNLKELAEFKHYPAGLAAAMLERQPDGSYLTLGADEARKRGLAASASVKNQEELSEFLSVLPGDVRSSESDMLDDLAAFLRNPWTRLVLVMLGITCLILELKMPGASLPGVVAAVCFVLFFWSHSQLGGQMTTLALLLFLLGLILLALEIFVIPGFGVCGISGIILVLGSLALVAYGHWPRSPEEWVGYGKTLGPIGLSMLGAIALAFTLARYLPSIPLANRLMLKPALEEGEAGEEAPPIQPELAALLGAIGVAATPLRPAGKTQFGDDYVDVVAEGNYIQPGARVQVIEIEGNRVVVKEV